MAVAGGSGGTVALSTQVTGVPPVAPTMVSIARSSDGAAAVPGSSAAADPRGSCVAALAAGRMRRILGVSTVRNPKIVSGALVTSGAINRPAGRQTEAPSTAAKSSAPASGRTPPGKTSPAISAATGPSGTGGTRSAAMVWIAPASSVSNVNDTSETCAQSNGQPVAAGVRSVQVQPSGLISTVMRKTAAWSGSSPKMIVAPGTATPMKSSWTPVTLKPSAVTDEIASAA